MLQINKYSLRLVKEDSYNYGLEKIRAGSPAEVVKILRSIELEYRTQETVILITVDIKANITGIMEVTTGTIDSSLLHPRDIFQRALLNNAKSIILAHNHPSNNTEPSSDDIEVTQRIEEAGKILDIELLDHIIIGEDNHYSFREAGLM